MNNLLLDSADNLRLISKFGKGYMKISIDVTWTTARRQAAQRSIIYATNLGVVSCQLRPVVSDNRIQERPHLCRAFPCFGRADGHEASTCSWPTVSRSPARAQARGRHSRYARGAACSRRNGWKADVAGASLSRSGKGRGDEASWRIFLVICSGRNAQRQTWVTVT